jgi:hypothetical protein
VLRWTPFESIFVHDNSLHASYENSIRLKNTKDVRFFEIPSCVIFCTRQNRATTPIFFSATNLHSSSYCFLSHHYPKKIALQYKRKLPIIAIMKSRQPIASRWKISDSLHPGQHPQLYTVHILREPIDIRRIIYLSTLCQGIPNEKSTLIFASPMPRTNVWTSCWPDFMISPFCKV